MSAVSSASPAATQAQRNMFREYELRKRFWQVVFVVLLFVCTVIFLAPFVWLISASLKTRADVFNGQWIPDMKLPLFATNRVTTSCRLKRGKWTLVSSGTEFTGPGKADRDHCLLMFVKVE